MPASAPRQAFLHGSALRKASQRQCAGTAIPSANHAPPSRWCCCYSITSLTFYLYYLVAGSGLKVGHDRAGETGCQATITEGSYGVVCFVRMVVTIGHQLAPKGSSGGFVVWSAPSAACAIFMRFRAASLRGPWPNRRCAARGPLGPHASCGPWIPQGSNALWPVRTPPFPLAFGPSADPVPAGPRLKTLNSIRRGAPPSWSYRIAAAGMPHESKTALPAGGGCSFGLTVVGRAFGRDWCCSAAPPRARDDFTASSVSASLSADAGARHQRWPVV